MFLKVFFNISNRHNFYSTQHFNLNLAVDYGQTLSAIFMVGEQKIYLMIIETNWSSFVGLNIAI